MTRAVVVGVSLFGVGCATEGPSPEQELAYEGIIAVTQDTLAGSTALTGSIFGFVVNDGEIVPNPQLGSCSYNNNSAVGPTRTSYIPLQRLTIEGFATKIVVDPDSLVYDVYFNPNPRPAAGSSITATFADDSGPVTVRATQPTQLVADLPETISLGGATVTWEPSDGQEVEVMFHVESLGQILRCLSADTGQFTVPPSALAQIVLPSDRRALLEVTRRHAGKTASEPAELELELAVESSIFRTVTLAP